MITALALAQDPARPGIPLQTAWLCLALIVPLWPVDLSLLTRAARRAEVIEALSHTPKHCFLQLIRKEGPGLFLISFNCLWVLHNSEWQKRDVQLVVNP